MNYKITTFMALIFVSIGAFVPIVNADSWAPPKKEKYYSHNKSFYLEVIPKQLESQLKYFEDKVEGKENAGATKGLKDNRAKASFYIRRADGGYSRKWDFPLVNEVSPVSALVSSKGDYVITFDNWHSVGYGDDVVVIYRSNGALIRKFGLEDILTEGDVETLPHSASSIWWGGKHYLDEANGLLVLKIVSKYKMPTGNNANVHELKIELATGRPLEPKRDLFPQLRVFSSVDDGSAHELSNASPSKPVCPLAEESFDLPGIVRIPSAQLYVRAKERPLPPYPPIAKAARAESAVVVEVLVSKAGDVICARSLSGHPLLRHASVAAALKWKFETDDSLGGTAKAVGTIAINFKLTESVTNSERK
jgi:TonB family protein